MNNLFIDPRGSNKAFVQKACEDAVKQVINFYAEASSHSPLPSSTPFESPLLQENGISLNEIQEVIASCLSSSMNAAHPGYIGHMDSIPTLASIIGDFVASAINNNMLSREMSPLFSQLETDLLQEIAQLFGLPKGACGVLLSGGSLANLHALAVARNHKFDTKEKGLFGITHHPVIFTSELSHTSIKKAAMLLGLGTDHVISIPVDAEGKLQITCLKEEILRAKKNSKTPFCVVATAGTTVLGSIDPLDDIAKVCEEHSLWLHVDAAYGGALVFSNDYKHKLAGIQRADSITFNPQKWLYVAKTCAMVLFKDYKQMKQDFTIPAPYMSEAGDGVNLGECSIQGSRRTDVIKLWLSLKTTGRVGYQELINKQMRLTQDFVDQLRTIPSIKLCHTPDLNIICFTLNEYTKKRVEKLHQSLLQKENIFLSTPLLSGNMIFRIVLLNPFTSYDEITRCTLHIKETLSV